MKKYITLWWVYTLRMTQIAFTSRLGVVIFTLGKFIRFGLYMFFIYILVSKTNSLAGYSLWEVLLFFATFNFIDTSAQFFLRDVYRFRQHVISGYFDTYLIKPMSPLFKALFGGSDVLDIPLILVSFFFIVYSAMHIGVTVPGVILYALLVINSLVIALAFHIFVVSLGILTTEIDNMLWMYRDLTQMGRIPVDIYREPIKSIITYVIPIGIMMTFPGKALLGILSVNGVLISFFVSAVILIGSLLFWDYALKSYASASS